MKKNKKIYGKIDSKERFAIPICSYLVKKEDAGLFLIGGELSPMIKYKRKYFSLSWEDIIDLAEDAGLFEEDTNEEANNGKV